MKFHARFGKDLLCLRSVTDVNLSLKVLRSREAATLSATAILRQRSSIAGQEVKSVWARFALSFWPSSLPLRARHPLI